VTIPSTSGTHDTTTRSSYVAGAALTVNRQHTGDAQHSECHGAGDEQACCEDQWRDPVAPVGGDDAVRRRAVRDGEAVETARAMIDGTSLRRCRIEQLPFVARVRGGNESRRTSKER
jgi:hypothetical protein